MAANADLAAAHAATLDTIRAHIPRYGSLSIDVGPGWYPLLTRIVNELDAAGYDFDVHQVKEKFGGLRFYWKLRAPEPGCCSEFRRNDPHPLGDPSDGLLTFRPRSPLEQEQVSAWEGRVRAHQGSPEHLAAEASTATSPKAGAFSETHRRLLAFVEGVEAESFTVCESCGASGALHERRGRLQTLCSDCACTAGFQPRVAPRFAGKATSHQDDQKGATS